MRIRLRRLGCAGGAKRLPRLRLHDCLGTRFAEIATGSYGAVVPENLIHIDINPNAIGANYPAKVGIAGDAGVAL